jgi:hypothetical protein
VYSLAEMHPCLTKAHQKVQPAVWGWLRLPVQDIDIATHQILVRDGKGNKDRLIMLPESATVTLQEHLAKIREIHRRDLAEGFGRVCMPYALSRKYPNGSMDWCWQFVFPQERRWKDPRTGQQAGIT